MTMKHGARKKKLERGRPCSNFIIYDLFLCHSLLCRESESLRLSYCFLFTLALILVENNFAHTYALRRYFNILVFLYVFKRFFEREINFRGNFNSCIATAGTHVGKLLCLGNIYGQIIRANMFANNLSAINLFSRINKETSAVLQFI